jgi:hypothetical protein
METGLERLFNATSKVLDKGLKVHYISLGKLLNEKEVRFENRTDDMMKCSTVTSIVEAPTLKTLLVTWNQVPCQPGSIG